MSESCGFTSSLNKLLIQGQKTEELYQNKDIFKTQKFTSLYILIRLMY